METKQTNQAKTPGVKAETKERKKEISKPLLVRQLGQNIMKTIEVGLLTAEEGEQMKKLHKIATTNYIEGTLIK